MKKLDNISLNRNNIGNQVRLFGWIAKKRNLGGMLFIDLRDRTGIIQLVIKPDASFFDVATSLKSESVLTVKGEVIARESINKNIPTGEVEVVVTELEVLNESSDTPFEVSDEAKALEDTRLKYRYLDLRRRNLIDNLTLRHQVTMLTRNYFSELGFLEIETPMLTKSTPEGARDYLVPSRVSKGKFYALPQSPQIFKQLLMVGGLEKYMQIVKCFRDEDLRADRQPEFTQIDLEMSFVNQEDIMLVMEGYLVKLFKDIKNYDLTTPIPRITYHDAVGLYGSDKPDLRFELPLINITDIFNQSDIAFLNEPAINAIVLKNVADTYSRKKLDELVEFSKKYQCQKLTYLKYTNQELTGGLVKNMSITEIENITSQLDLADNDLVIMALGTYSVVKQTLGAIRLKVAKDLDLIKTDTYQIVWVVDFPMFEYNEEEGRYTAMHHPFTSPKTEELEKLIQSPGECMANAYDLVINGSEVGGGSIRIHQSDIQSTVFKALNISDEEANQKFGFLIEALKYGAPPHGGIAFGLDRLIMILAGTENVRDVIAFPKTSSAACLMSEAPNIVDTNQLEELSIQIKS